MEKTQGSNQSLQTNLSDGRMLAKLDRFNKMWAAQYLQMTRSWAAQTTNVLRVALSKNKNNLLYPKGRVFGQSNKDSDKESNHLADL